MEMDDPWLEDYRNTVTRGQTQMKTPLNAAMTQYWGEVEQRAEEKIRQIVREEIKAAQETQTWTTQQNSSKPLTQSQIQDTEWLVYQGQQAVGRLLSLRRRLEGCQGLANQLFLLRPLDVPLAECTKLLVTSLLRSIDSLNTESLLLMNTLESLSTSQDLTDTRIDPSNTTT